MHEVCIHNTSGTTVNRMLKNDILNCAAGINFCYKVCSKMLKIKSCMNTEDPVTVVNDLSKFYAVSLLLLVLGMIVYLG